MGKYMVDGIGSASFLEIIWTAIAAFGTVHLGYLWWQALLDERYLKRRGVNGIRSVVARMGVRSEFTALCVMIVFLGLGVLAMFTPPVDSGGDFRWFPFLASLAFFIVAIMKDYDAVMRRQERRIVFELEARRIRRERAEIVQ